MESAEDFETLPNPFPSTFPTYQTRPKGCILIERKRGKDNGLMSFWSLVVEVKSLVHFSDAISWKSREKSRERERGTEAC